MREWPVREWPVRARADESKRRYGALLRAQLLAAHAQGAGLGGRAVTRPGGHRSLQSIKTEHIDNKGGLETRTIALLDVVTHAIDVCSGGLTCSCWQHQR